VTGEITMNTAAGLQVLDIQRLSTEDGPGLRTTLFTKGCPLRCAWCHNPESISPKRQILWVGQHCIGCRLCVNACPISALDLSENGIKRDILLCTGCAACSEACPTGANELKGELRTVEELCHELCKDRAYFEESGGGVTISGGDPMMQGEEVSRLLALLKAEGISTAIDSALLTTKQNLDTVLDHTDHLLLDLKLADEEEHKKWTGVSNTVILENAKYVADRMRRGKNPARLWIRTPIIPNATATGENIRGIARFIAAELSDVFERWELCAFNNLCKDKYARLAQDWQFATTPLMLSEDMDSLLDEARAQLTDFSEKISWTGAVQLKELTV
jgi:pyruvate formate lyase activating enzyme